MNYANSLLVVHKPY